MLFKQSPILLLLLLIVNGLAYSFFTITLPSLGRLLDYSDRYSGFLLGASALLLTLSSPIWGKLCERWGRRKVILYGILATTLFNLFSALIIHARLELFLSVQMSFYLLLFTRVLNAVFTGGLKPASQAYLADITAIPHRAKGMGALGAAFGFGAILGGLCARLSGQQYLVHAYLFISLALLIISITAVFYLQESSYQPSSSNLSLSRLPYARIGLFLLITFLGLTVFSALQHVLALTLQDRFQLPSDQAIKTTGLTMMLTMSGMLLTQALLLRFIPLSPLKLILTGAIMCALALFSAAFAQTTFSLTLAFCLTGVGLGILLPGNLAALSISVDDKTQGAVAGVNGIGQGIGLATGPLLGVLLHQVSFAAPYLMCALAMFMLVLFALVAQQRYTLSAADKAQRCS